jgi:hypothetical protein
MEMFYGNGDWDYHPSAGLGFIIDTRERLMNPHREFIMNTGQHSMEISLGVTAFH